MIWVLAKPPQMKEIPSVGSKERTYHLLNLELAERGQGRTAADKKPIVLLEAGSLVPSRAVNACFQACLLKAFCGSLLRITAVRSEATQMKACPLSQHP